MCVSRSDKAPSFFTKDVLPTGTNNIIEHGEQINVGVAVLTEGVVKPELCSATAM